MSALRTALPALGLGLVILVNYGIHRLRPELAAQADLRGQLAALDQAPLAAGAAGLGRELRLVEVQIARSEARLARARPLASAREATEVGLRLAALADAVGLKVLDSAPAPRDSQPPSGAAPRGSQAPSHLPSDGEVGRPREAWRLRGTYSALQAFVAGLDALPWRVVLAKLVVDRLPSGELELRCELAL